MKNNKSKNRYSPKRAKSAPDIVGRTAGFVESLRRTGFKATPKNIKIEYQSPSSLVFGGHVIEELKHNDLPN